MGNKLGIKPGSELTSSKFKELFEKFAKSSGGNKIDKETAHQFLKALAEEAKLDFSSFNVEEILTKIDPYGIGLDFHRFQVFFFESTKEARQKGDLKLSASMEGSANLTVKKSVPSEKEEEELDLCFSTHLQTDKPIYKPGETVYWRAWVVHCLTNKPLSTEDARKHISKQTPIKVELLSPSDELVETKFVTFSSIEMDEFVNIADCFVLSSSQAGGNYKIKLSFQYVQNFTPAERIVQIKAFDSPPQLNLQLEFVKKGLGASDLAHAKLEVKRADGNIPKGAKVSSIARIDGQQVWQGEGELNEEGTLELKFQLPAKIEVGDGSLTCTVTDEGVVEGTSQTIPIILQKLDVNFYPEGGELIYGLENKLYFEASTPFGDSADFFGLIVDSKGNPCATAQTNHEGRGRTSFIPKKGEKYSLKVLSPSGISFQNGLPKGKKEGIVLSSVADVYDELSSVKLNVSSSEKGTFKVSLFKKFYELSSQKVEFTEKCETKSIIFDLSESKTLVQGVIRVTVFNEKNIPLSERLIFFEPPNLSKTKVKVDLGTQETKFPVGEELKFNISISHSSEKEIDAIFGVSIVDESVLEMVSKRKQVPRLPFMVYLETEVDRLDDAKIFLDRTNPKSKLALDLLLGTQGWRRFAFKSTELNYSDFIRASEDKSNTSFPKAKNKEAAYRLLGKTQETLPLETLETKLKRLEEELRVENTKRLTVSTSSFSSRNRLATPSSILAAPVQNFSSSSMRLSSAPQKLSNKSIESKTNESVEKNSSMKTKLALIPREKEESKESDKKVASKPMKKALVERTVESKSKQSTIPLPPAETKQRLPQPTPTRTSNLTSSSSFSIAPPSRNLIAPPSRIAVSRRAPPISSSSRVNELENQIKELKAQISNALNVTRFYAHLNQKKKEVREDFTTTLLWIGGVKFKANNKNNFTACLSDSITSFRIYVEGITSEGTAFCETKLLKSCKSFYLDTKLPVEVSAEDKPILPVTIFNETGTDLSELSLKFSRDKEGLEFIDKSGSQLLEKLIQGGRKRVNLETLVLNKDHKVSVLVEAKSGVFEDTIKKSTNIKSQGFPAQLSASGELTEENGTEIHSFSLPKDFCKGSVKTNFQLYLSALSNMTGALKALIRQPCGCFEQTSSIVYPMVMAQQYFLSHRNSPEDLIKRAKENIEYGYNRLKGFGVDKGRDGLAFDWYGKPPGNESLTAYGLLEFNDMKQVYPVENAMLERVKKWLLSRRNGKGQFERSAGRYGFGNAPAEITNAYICWSLTEQGANYEELKQEVDSLLPLCKTDKKNDPYYLSLVTCVLYNLKLTEKAEEVALQLTELQRKDGCVCGSNDSKLHDTRFTSITYAYGDSLFISSTGLAIYAWLKAGTKYSTFVKKANKWLMSKCQGGSFGSTDATINALKAIVEYDKIFERAVGTKLKISLNGKIIQELEVNEELLSKLNISEPLLMNSFAEKLEEGGDFELEIKAETKEGKSLKIPYSVTVDYHSLKPEDSDNCELSLQTKLNSLKLKEGEATEVEVVISNNNKKSGQPMTIAIVGIPGGLEVRTQKLDELVKAKKIDFYEMRGRDLCLYLIAMDKQQEVKVNVDVLAKIPGTFYGPASRVYLYYTPEEKKWNEPLKIEIEPLSN